MSKFNAKLAHLKTRVIIRYQELFEGVGEQLIARLTTPIKNSKMNSNSPTRFEPPPIDNSTFKQLAGCVTLIYVILIAVLSLCLGLAYTFWPEERLHHTNLIFLIVICALIFGICLIAFCIYAKIYRVGGEIRSYSPSFGNLEGMDSLGSVAYGRNVKINITNHPGTYGNVNAYGYDSNNGFSSNNYSKVENIPSWDNNYSDLQDDVPDFDEIRHQQGVNRANLQFLKHID